MPILLRGFEGIKAYSGFNLGKSSWLEVDQEMINAFACATNCGCVHDAEDGTREGPFRGTMAPSYLILSLVIPMLRDIYLLEDTGPGMHYGIDGLRFLASVPASSSIRLDATLKSVEAVGEEGQLVLRCVVECDATRKPVLEAEILYRFRPPSQTRVQAIDLCKSS